MLGSKVQLAPTKNNTRTTSDILALKSFFSNSGHGFPDWELTAQETLSSLYRSDPSLIHFVGIGLLQLFVNILCDEAEFLKLCYLEVRNSRVMKSSYEAELRIMTSHFDLLTRKCL